MLIGSFFMNEKTPLYAPNGRGVGMLECGRGVLCHAIAKNPTLACFLCVCSKEFTLLARIWRQDLVTEEGYT
jgi:hypothetical protein